MPNSPRGRLQKEEALWWAVIRQAARDIKSSHHSEAEDAKEFLESTGLWLTTSVLNLSSEEKYIADVTKLIQQRNKRFPVPLGLPNFIRLS
jgi:hypothetical protein